MKLLDPRAISTLAITLIVAGCGVSSHVSTHATSPCRYHTNTKGEPGLAAGWDYETTRHAFGSPSSLTLCWPNGSENGVRVSAASPNIDVTPPTRAGVGPTYVFQVTVSAGSGGGLKVEILNDRGEAGAGFYGPTIVTDDTGWSFAPWS